MHPPIYSVKAHCRDCYKCVRHCPVKSIEVTNDHATVNADGCILCGNCVSVCSHAAKVVRDDLPRVKELLNFNQNVHVSLAPSFITEFNDVDPATLSAALKKLGFASVHETAAGAEIVSRNVAAMMNSAAGGIHLSTACPVAVDLVTHYFPHLTANLTPLLPPVLAHAKEIKSIYGRSAEIVFVGPCIAKKRDADNHPDLIHTALTFEELRHWLTESRIDFSELAPDTDYLRPGNCAVYPLEGGMNATIRNLIPDPLLKNRLLTISGIDEIQKFLKNQESLDTELPLFIELLACQGGCIAGPKTSRRNRVNAHLEILNYVTDHATIPDTTPEISCEWQPGKVTAEKFSEEAITNCLHQLGKYQPEDELNCGGCGYDSCRQLATALLQCSAEPQMCVSYMRQLAQKKNNALARALPYGLVIANANLRIIECNQRFAELMGETLLNGYESGSHLRNVDLTRILPFPRLFKTVLQTGEAVIRKTLKIEEKIFSVSVFNVEPHTLVGALIMDVTDKEQRRQQVIEKSRTVIRNTTETVQKIAYMLGKNSAQSELILNSAIEMFATEENEDNCDDLH